MRAKLLRQIRAEMIEPPTATQVDTVIRSALHQADECAAARLARAEGCTRRLDALVFTTLTGHCPAQGEANAEDDEDACRSRTGAGRRWGRSAGVRPAAGNASPAYAPGVRTEDGGRDAVLVDEGGHRRRTGDRRC